MDAAEWLTVNVRHRGGATRCNALQHTALQTLPNGQACATSRLPLVLLFPPFVCVYPRMHVCA